MTADLLEIANRFALKGSVRSIDTLGDGFINDTFIIRTEDDDPDYILQRKNKNVFKDVPAMMENIRKVTEHICRRIVAEGGDPQRETLTVIPTRDGRLYYKDDDEEFWAVTRYIADTVAYSKADTETLARKGGEGIGRFQEWLSDFTEPLTETIHGFHNIRYRFEQWDEAVARNAAGHCEQLSVEMEWIESRRAEMLAFWAKVEDGTLPMRVTHNDTKISNILFDQNSAALCVIDLDTVMNATSLNDFGDAIRTYANTGEEDDIQLDRVGLSLPMFRAFAEGYLFRRAQTLCPAEIDHLAFSVRYIVFEQVLRFLMDYVDGDTYYKIKYPQHNLVRARAQYKLLQSVEAQYPEMCRIIAQAVEKFR